MSEKTNSLECNAICWGIATFVGFVSMVMLYLLADFTALQAIFTGGLIGFLLGCVLSLFVCRGPKSPALNDGSEKPAQRYAREAAEDKARRAERMPSGSAAASGGATAAPGGHEAAGAAAEAAGGGASSDASGGANTPSSFASSTPAVKPSAPLAGQAELASRKGEWTYDAGAGDGKTTGIDASKAAAIPAGGAVAAAEADAPGTVDQDKAVPAGETAAPAVAPSADAVDAATVAKEPAGDTTTKGMTAAAEGASGDGKPMLYTSPPAEGADDLKLISGVGPKLEQTLNEMGIYRFDQVAVWGSKEIAWVDDRLRFKGRIERDDWMSQAKVLAAGGETEFSKRKKK